MFCGKSGFFICIGIEFIYNPPEGECRLVPQKIKGYD